MASKGAIVRMVAKLNDTNDTYPGGGDASPGLVPGMVGAELELDATQAALLSNSTVTLKSGRYRYVNFKSGSTASNARGQAVFTLTSAGFEINQVSPDGDATLDGLCAGVALNVVSKGSYGWIQVSGNADCLFTSSITDATIGNAVVIKTTTNKFDSLADATAVATAGVAKAVVGVSLAASTNSTISAVLLKGLHRQEV